MFSINFTTHELSGEWAIRSTTSGIVVSNDSHKLELVLALLCRFFRLNIQADEEQALREMGVELFCYYRQCVCRAEQLEGRTFAEWWNLGDALTVFIRQFEERAVFSKDNLTPTEVARWALTELKKPVPCEG